MQVVFDHDDGQVSRREQLLAMYEVRRDLECVTASALAFRTFAMTTGVDLVRELHELIAALDRRVPQLERAEEIAIARDAAELRARAVKRLAELEHDGGAPGSSTT